MDARLAMQLLEAGRVGLGAGLVAAPVALGRPWVGPPAERPGGQVALRALGVRDTVLGTGAVLAARRGPAEAAAGWALALAACDLVDGVATFLARDELPSRGVPVMGLAFGAAAAGVAVAAALRG